MTKIIMKKRSVLKLLASVAVVMLMSISMVLPAFANPDPLVDWVYSDGTPENPAPSAITKIFTVPLDTTVPSSTFSFVLTQVGIDNTNNKDGMPDIGPITITISEDDLAAFEEKKSERTLVIEDKVKGTLTIVKESLDILNDVAPEDWPGRGIYTYILREEKKGITPQPGAVNEDWEYSDAHYTIEFWVEEDDDGNLFVQYVNAKVVKNHIDGWHKGKVSEDGKVDPTPGEYWEDEYTTIENGFSQVIFTNLYWKSDGPGEPEDPDDFDKGALAISKIIDGNDADKTMLFDFEVTVTQPIIIPDEQEYTAYIVDSAGNVISGAIKFKSGEKVELKLTDGQRLVFMDLHVGAKVEVWELGDEDGHYKPKYERTFVNPGTYYGEAGVDLGFPRNPEDKGPHFLPEGSGTNKVIYTNTRTGATPMGLDVDDLPYVVLIGLAVAGLVGFMVVRSRRKDEYDA